MKHEGLTKEEYGYLLCLLYDRVIHLLNIDIVGQLDEEISELAMLETLSEKISLYGLNDR